MCVEEGLESGNLLQRISDAIKRPFYSGAGGLHSYDDRDRNSSSDESLHDKRTVFGWRQINNAGFLQSRFFA